MLFIVSFHEHIIVNTNTSKNAEIIHNKYRLNETKHIYLSYFYDELVPRLMIAFFVFLSGLSRIMKHFGPKSAIKRPKLEARMANTSTASAYLPGELT